MFKATKPFKDTITGYDNEPSLRIGKKVPKDAVNLAYYYNPTATDAEKILASDPPRPTIDHRIETQWLTKTDIASGPNGEEPSIDLFPKAIYYSDEEGYYGRLKRQDETVKWYPEKHVNQKEVTRDNEQIVDKKGDEDKVIEYQDADGYKGNLYLDTATYETYTTKDVSTEEILDYTINDFELNYHEIFGGYLNSDDINNGPWTNVPNPVAGEDYCWPARIEITPTNLVASDTGLATTNTNNRIANFINGLTNKWEGSNEQFINNPNIISSSKPVGFLYFDKLEYEPVKYNVEPKNGSISKERTIPDIKSDEFPWKVTHADDQMSYQNSLPTFDDVKINGSKLDKTSYMSDMGQDYTEIDNFIAMLENVQQGSYQSTIKTLQDAKDAGKDIAIWMHSLKFVIKDETIDMLIDGSVFEGNKENEIHEETEPSPCYFLVGFKYVISDRGTEGTMLYNITANYHSVWLQEAGHESVTRTIITRKEEATSYKAHCHYSGLADKNWIDYDGIAFYMGSVTKGNSVGNQNADDDNELLMFPDKDGYLRQIVEGLKTETDENNRPIYSVEYRNYYRIEADTVYLTNVFKDGEGCFYKYTLKEPIYDYRGPDEYGFYQGDAVQIYTSTLKEIPDFYKHNMTLRPAEYEEVKTYDKNNNPVITKIPKSYYAELYTNFVSSSTDTFKVVYNGFNDNKSDNKAINNGIEEDIYNAPYMINGLDYRLCSINRKTRLSYIQILNYQPIKDERLRVTFSWRVVATDKTNHKEFYSVTRQSSILNKDYCIPCEYKDFEDRGMIISPKLNGDSIPCSPRDLCINDQAGYQSADNDYEPVIADGAKTFVYKVEIIEISQPGSVNVKCNPDGSGYITAETTLDTGFYDTLRFSYTKKLDIENPYWTDGQYIYQGYKVKCIDSRNIKIKAPREKGLLDSWYPLIQFGHFSRIMDQYGAHTKVCYSMPEYDTQHYSKTYGQPYVDVTKEQVTILNSHMVKLKCYPLHLINPKYDSDTFKYNNKFYLVVKERKTWKEAEELCQKAGGHLAMPKTKEELSYVSNIAKKYEINGMWLGGTDEEVEGIWKWVDGTLMEYSNWNTGEPNNLNQEHYLETYTSGNVAGKWNDLSNTNTSAIDGFICELSINVKLYKKVDNELFALTIENISFSDGIVITKEALSENDLILADYTYLEENYQYRGYWRNDADFVRIDLNPNIYHTYNDPAFLPSSVSASKNLFNKVIYFFLKPTGVYEIAADNDSLYYGKDGFETKEVTKTRKVQKYKYKTITKQWEEETYSPTIDIREVTTAYLPYDPGYKEVLKFTVNPSEVEYRGPFTFTMRSGHWYKFIVQKRTQEKTEELEEQWSEIGMCDTPPATHSNTEPLSRTINEIVFVPGETYRILTQECKGGGEEADKFIYNCDISGKLLVNTITKETKTSESEVYDGTEEVTEEYTGTELVPVEEIDNVVQEIDRCLYHKIDDSEPDNDEDMLLGSVYIRQDTSLHSTIITDSRTRGGGILESMSDSLRHELEPESDYYLDIGYYDGKPYQENGVIIVRLDNRILKDFGGKFTSAEVEQKVKRWIGAGIYPIIEYVDSYKKEDLPQYTLEVQDNYTNVIDVTPAIYADYERGEEYIIPIEANAKVIQLEDVRSIMFKIRPMTF